MTGHGVIVAGSGVCVEPALAHALADELTGLTTLLADLAYDLAGNADTLRNHMHSLQGIDRITQVQLAIADMLRSPAPAEDRVTAVVLEDLAARIGGALRRYRYEGVPAVPYIDGRN